MIDQSQLCSKAKKTRVATQADFILEIERILGNVYHILYKFRVIS